MKYIELVVKSENKLREEILNIFYKNDIFTLEEYSKEILNELNNAKDSWDYVDSEIFKLKDEELIIKAYPHEEKLAKKIKKELNEKNIYCEFIEKDDEDWANNWKKYYHPIEVGKRLLIKPSWEEIEDTNRKIIEIDPGMAFGTGSHETTYMCLEALEKYLKKDQKVFDVGCGSGILSIAGVKLGAKKVIAVDLDKKCVEVTLKNAKLNKVEDKIEVYEGNLLDVVEGSADLIVSNIIAEIIAGLVGDLRVHLNEKGIFISSGIIKEKIDLVEKALKENGFEILEIREKNGWALVVGRLYA